MWCIAIHAYLALHTCGVEITIDVVCWRAASVAFSQKQSEVRLIRLVSRCKMSTLPQFRNCGTRMCTQLDRCAAQSGGSLHWARLAQKYDS